MKSLYKELLVWVATPFMLSALGSGALPQDMSTDRESATVQTQGKDKTTTDAQKWRDLLDNLAIESRTLDSEEERPPIIAEVADAYWNLSRDRSKELFVLAFETALTLPTEKQTKAVTRVLSLVSKRDRSLVMLLARRLEHTSDRSLSGDVLKVARDLVESDPQLAMELGKIDASTGPSMSGLWLVFKLAERDSDIAQRLYEGYFQNLIARRELNLSSVLWLAGYPFGYGEAYGGSPDPSSFIGFGGLRVPRLTPQPRLAVAFLSLAFAAVSQTLQQASQAPHPEKEVLSSLALFASVYLLPEAQRYSPNSQPEWSALYQLAFSGTSEKGRAAVERRLQSIIEVRSTASDYKSSEDLAGQTAKDTLDRIDRLSGGCERDRAYAQVAFALSYRKDFNQAWDIAANIHDVSVRDDTRQFISYDMTDQSITKGDLNRALQLAESVAAKGLRAMLYVKIATKAAKRTDKSMVLDLLNRARSLVQDPSDPRLQAGIYLAIAGAYAQVDTLEANNVMRDAIKAVNRVKEQSHDTFSILRRVNLSCGESDKSWYGGDQPEKISLYDTLASIASSDIQGDGTLALAYGIDDRATRLRAELSVVKTLTKMR